MEQPDPEAYFGMGVVARMVNMHPQTIRHYERIGLVRPTRSTGNVRLFSQRDVRRLQKIHSLTEMGVNLAGVEIIVRLLERIADAEEDMLRLREELQRLRR